jgi:hypothetical protein
VTLIELWAYLRDGGMLALLFLILVGGWRRYWVFGWYAEELRERIVDLEKRLERATRVAESGTAAADRATRVAERHTGAADEQ